MSLWTEFRDSMSSVVAFPADYFGGWFGVAPSESGVEVNELTAMQISAFVGCVRIISGAVATLPLRVMEALPDGSERVADDHPLDYMLNNRPNRDVSAADFFETGQSHMLTTGNTYAEIAYNGAGQPTELYLRSPFRTFPYRRPNGDLIYKTNEGQGSSERIMEAANVVHVKGLGVDSLVGLSPVKYYAREVLGNDLAAQSYSSKFFANDSRPGGFLKTKTYMTNEKKLEAAKSWASGHSRGQSHRMAILDGDFDWVNVTVPPDQAQFLQTREFNRSQIACIFGVPEHYLGERVESRANMEQRGIEFLTFTIRPWLNKWEQALNARLFPRTGRNAGRYFARFDTTQYARATYADLLKGVQMGRYAGLYTVNEGRRLLGEQPYSKEQLTSKDPADKLMMPINMFYVSEDLTNPAAGQVAGEGSGGNDQSGGDGGGKPAKPNQQGGKRDAEIKRYFAIFYPTFRDALGRILAREKANQGDFQRLFGPVLIQIASAFSFRSDAEPGDMSLSAPKEEFIREYIGFLAHRAKDWTAAKADEVATEELKRAIEVLREKCVEANAEEEKDSEETEA